MIGVLAGVGQSLLLYVNHNPVQFSLLAGTGLGTFTFLGRRIVLGFRTDQSKGDLIVFLIVVFVIMLVVVPLSFVASRELLRISSLIGVYIGMIISLLLGLVVYKLT